MPSTINGIGTNYIGKKNHKVHRGVCDRCNQTVMLEDYETGLWFTILYIPVIPLGRKQVLDYCPSCTGHRVTDPAQWQKLTTEGLAEAREKVRQNPNDVEAALDLLGMYHAFHRKARGQEHADWIATQFANNAEAQFGLGTWYELTNRPQEATKAFDRAFALDPSNLDARRAVGVGAIEQGDLARARDLLGFMETPGPKSDPYVLAMLGAAFQDRQDHAQALELFRCAAAGSQELARDKAFRKMVRASEQAAGMKMDQARASSRPARAMPPSQPPQAVPSTAAGLAPGHLQSSGQALDADRGMAPVRSGTSQRTRWLMGVAALLAVLWVINFIVASYRTVHVVNGLDGPVQVLIDGEEVLTLQRGDHQEISVSEGAHTAAFISESGRRGEAEIEIDGVFCGRFFSDKVHVLNPFGAAVVVSEKRGYYNPSVPKSERRDSEVAIYAGLPWIVLDDLNFVFKDFPEEIKTESDDPVIYRKGASVMRGTVTELLPMVMSVGNPDPDDLMRFVEAHLAERGGDRDLLQMYVGIGVLQQRGDRARDFLAEGLDHTPFRVDWHRMYQEICERTGQGEQMVKRYAAMLRTDPSNSVLLYLNGRVQVTGRETMAYMDKAIAADATNAYPWLAKAFGLLGRGQFAEARDAAAKAVSLAPDNDGMKEMLTNTRMATGDLDALKREVERQRADAPADFGLYSQYVEILAAADDLGRGDRVCADYVRRVREELPEARDTWQTQRRARAVLARMKQDYTALRRLAGALTDQETANLWLLEAALGSGDPVGAARLASSASITQWETELLIAIQAAAQGKGPLATEWRSKARQRLADGSRDEQVLAALIASGAGVDVEAALDVVAYPASKVLVLVALAQQRPDAKLIALAEKLNYAPGVARGIVRKAIAKLKSGAP